MDPRDFNRDENDSRPLSASSDGPERRAVSAFNFLLISSK